MLIAFSGLPGVGKTAIARELARTVGAVHLRIDSIEQALRRAGYHVEGEGYEVAYAVTDDNLRTGQTVIADCVHPWPLTRDAWRSVAERTGVAVAEIEIVCPDPVEHRRRVESREPDIAGHTLPTWRDVVERDYRPWDRDRLVVDTARCDTSRGVRAIERYLSAAARFPTPWPGKIEVPRQALRHAPRRGANDTAARSML